MATLATLKAIFTADATQFERAIASVEKRISQVGSQLSSAGATMTKAFTLPLAGAGAGLVLLTKNIANVGDELIKMQDRTGISVETLSGLRRSAELSGASLQDVGTGMKLLAKNMSDVNAGVGEEARRAFEGLGISVTDAGGKLKSVEQVFFEMSDAFSKLDSEEQKLDVTQKLLGRSGTNLILMMNQGPKALRSQIDETQKLGTAYGELESREMERFNDRWLDVSFAMEGVKKKIANAIIPALADLAEWLVKFITESGFIQKMVNGFKWLADSFIALPTPIKIAIAGFVGLLAAMGPVLVVAGFLIPAIGTALAGAFLLLVNPIALAVAGAFAFGAVALLIWKNWDAVSAFFTGPVADVFKATGDVFVAVGRLIADTFIRLAELMKGIGMVIASHFLTPFRLILEGVEKFIGTLADAAHAVADWTGVGKGFADSLTNAKNAINNAGASMDKLRTDSIENLKKKFSEMGQVSGKEVVDAFNRAKTAGVALGGELKGAVLDNIERFKKSLEGIGTVADKATGAVSRTALALGMTNDQIVTMLSTTSKSTGATAKMSDALTVTAGAIGVTDKALEKMLTSKDVQKAPTLMGEMTKELRNLSVMLKSGSQLTNLWAASFSASFGATLGAMRSELERIGGFIQQKFVDLFGSDGAGGSIGRIVGTFFGTFTQQVINRFVALWTDKLIKTLTGTVPALQQVFGTATTGLNQMATASTATSTAMQNLPSAVTGTIDTFKNLATEKDKLIPNMNNLTSVTTGTSGAFGNLAAQTASATSNLNQFIPAINSSTTGINNARSAEEALLATLERSRIIGLPTPLGTQFSSVQTTSLLDQLLAAAGIAGGGGIAGLLGGLGAGAGVANFIGSLRPESLTNPITAAIGAIMSGLNFAGIDIPIISNIQGFIGGVFGSITNFFSRFFGGSGASRDRAVSLLNAFRDWASPLATQAESFATGGNFAAAINNLFTGRQLSEHSEVNQFPGIGDRARELMGWGGTVGDYIRSNAGDILGSIISQTDAAVAQLRDAESQRIDFNLRRDAVSRLAGLSSGAFGRGLEMAALFPSPFFATLANFAHGGPVGFDNPELAVMHPNDRFVLTGSGPNSIQELAKLISQGGGRPSVTNNFNIEINEAGGPIDVDKLSRDLTWRMEQTLRAVVVK